MKPALPCAAPRRRSRFSRHGQAAAALLALACQAAPVRPAPAVPAPPPSPSSVSSPSPVPDPSVSRARADVAALPDGDRPELSLASWREQHEAALDESNGARRAQASLVVLGDSIAHGWSASRSFTRQWREDRPLNLALPGEQTQHLLWRIEHGALAGLEPRLVVLIVGVFNLVAGFTAEETAGGVAALLSRVQRELPEARVLVVSLLPAGQAPSDPLRARIEATNRELRALAQPERVVVVDVGGMFIDADGTISSAVMSDGLLPTELGYTALTTALSLVTRRLLSPG